MSGPIEVNVTLGGTEIAKWCARVGKHHLGPKGQAVADGIQALYSSGGVVVELADRDLPYLDPNTTVQFMLFDGPWCAELDWSNLAAVGAAALEALVEALGDVRVTALRVEVVER